MRCAWLPGSNTASAWPISWDSTRLQAQITRCFSGPPSSPPYPRAGAITSARGFERRGRDASRRATKTGATSSQEEVMSARDVRVDAYLAKAAPFARPILEHVRATVHAGCPAVEETI